jgi:hypothetical protein
VHTAAKDAVTNGSMTANAIVSEQWLDREEGDDYASTMTLCEELYAAIKLNEGSVSIHSAGARNAIKYGILALNPKGANVSLEDEPLIARALEAIGDAIVFGTRFQGVDPVFHILASCLQSGEVSGFQFTASVKGPIWEVAFAWHVVRTMLMWGDDTTLARVLNPLLADGHTLPESIGCRKVTHRRDVKIGKPGANTSHGFSCF